MITDQTAARLGELLASATPGPFEPIKGGEENDDMRCGVSAMRGKFGFLVVTIENGAPGDFCDTEWDNAQLISLALNALPALLAEREAMNAEIARLTSQVEQSTTLLQTNHDTPA